VQNYKLKVEEKSELYTQITRFFALKLHIVVIADHDFDRANLPSFYLFEMSVRSPKSSRSSARAICCEVLATDHSLIFFLLKWIAFRLQSAEFFLSTRRSRLTNFGIS
jgi:hypothetical protein